MKVKLTYDKPSVRGVSHVYKSVEYGSVSVIVYAPKTETVRPPLEIEIPDWWVNNTVPSE